MLETEKNTSWYLDGYLPTAGEVITIQLDPLPFTVGRISKSSFVINRNTISSIHAEITEEAGNYFVRDLDSTNGTYLNGRRIVGKTPIDNDDLLQFGDIAFRVLRKCRVSEFHTVSQDVEDGALALVQFRKLLSDSALCPHFQPIVDLETEDIVGYEALSRSRLVGLETPQKMFDAALKLNQEVELSCAMRSEALRVSSSLSGNFNIFLNTHPSEIKNKGIFESLRVLRKIAKSTPITIEIHEAVVTDIETMIEIREGLSSLDMKLAFDDFGAGQARLAELISVSPDYLKFDRKIISNIHESSNQHQSMLRNLVLMSKDLGITPLAEGVECRLEAEACRRLGFELSQGYYFGKPTPIRGY